MTNEITDKDILIYKLIRIIDNAITNLFSYALENKQNIVLQHKLTLEAHKMHLSLERALPKDKTCFQDEIKV